MQHRRAILTAVATTLLGGCSSQSDGTEPEPVNRPDGTGTGQTLTDSDIDLRLRTTAFEDGGTIPLRYTADGQNVSPPLTIEGVPDSAVSLALVVDDPDAPGGTFTHWLLWNIPPSTTSIPEAIPAERTLQQLDGAGQGTTDLGVVGYRGPAPPPEDGPHTYRFTLFALDMMLELEAGSDRSELDSAMSGHVLARARITGEYDR